MVKNKRWQPVGYKNPLLIKNNRGQIGATITWMVAFLIIFFILMLYLIGVGVLVLGGESNKFSSGYEESEVNSLANQRRMIVLLNSEVDFLGDKVKLSDAILDSMSIYSNDEFFLGLGVDNFDDIKNIDVVRKREVLEYIFSDNVKVDEIINNMMEQEEALNNILLLELNDECYAYYFKFPLYEKMFFNGKSFILSFARYLKDVYSNDVKKSVFILSDNGRDFTVEVYSAKKIGGKCNEE